MKILLFALLVFVTNIIQSVTGFAGTLLAMPTGILLVGMEEAKAVLNVMALIASAMIVIADWRHINLRQLGRICLFMGIGILLGLILLQFAQVNHLLTIYGLFIICFALFNFCFKSVKLPTSRLVLCLVLVAAGIIHGLFISGGSLLVIYAVAVLPEKQEFRSTLSGVWLILNSFLMIQHIASGYFTREAVLLTVVCLIPLFAAVKLGAYLHSRVRQKTFLYLTYALLLVSGCLILF